MHNSKSYKVQANKKGRSMFTAFNFRFTGIFRHSKDRVVILHKKAVSIQIWIMQPLICIANKMLSRN